jgi:hypothetical protein
MKEIEAERSLPQHTRTRTAASTGDGGCASTFLRRGVAATRRPRSRLQKPAKLPGKKCWKINKECIVNCEAWFDTRGVWLPNRYQNGKRIKRYARRLKAASSRPNRQKWSSRSGSMQSCAKPSHPAHRSAMKTEPVSITGRAELRSITSDQSDSEPIAARNQLEGAAGNDARTNLNSGGQSFFNGILHPCLLFDCRPSFFIRVIHLFLL